jgi:hypothetical protein
MQAASPEETAAILAAIAQFQVDTAPPPSGEGKPTEVSPWVRAARLEGVDRDPGWVSRG